MPTVKRRRTECFNLACKLRRRPNVSIHNGRLGPKDARNWGIEVVLLTDIYLPVAPGA